jgi:Kdo2-lipid IVA lauroyltransferase/acyltransferase
MIILAGIMPFKALYIFSDFIYLLIYHVIGYRRNVVSSNLRSSFPEKNAKERLLIERQFYHHLCDISLESIKGFTMSPQEIIRRHHILNPALADYYFDNNLSVIAVPGHYNNWEWGSLSPGLQIKSPIVAFYKPLNNRLVDAFVKKHRAKFNTSLASIRETALTFNDFGTTPNVFIMASDQSPTNLRDCYWFDFLNHDTPWLHGPEKYARKYNWPVIYVDIQKVKRGFYELNLAVLTENPASLPDGEITRLYAKHLENSILMNPAYWLWSHRRWKHQRD